RWWCGCLRLLLCQCHSLGRRLWGSWYRFVHHRLRCRSRRHWLLHYGLGWWRRRLLYNRFGWESLSWLLRCRLWGRWRRFFYWWSKFFDRWLSACLSLCRLQCCPGLLGLLLDPRATTFTGELVDHQRTVSTKVDRVRL